MVYRTTEQFTDEERPQLFYTYDSVKDLEKRLNVERRIQVACALVIGAGLTILALLVF